MTLLILAAGSALLVSALCSLLEATLLSLNPGQIAEMSVRRPRAAEIWNRFKKNIEQPIAVILILNTAAHTIGATVAGAQFEKLYGEKWIIAFSLVLTYLMLQFTEILPKTLGVSYNRKLAPIIATPLAALVRFLSPVLRFVHLVNRPFERSVQKQQGPHAIEEIAAMASMARMANLIDVRQARLIEAASKLPEMRIRQIMIPRSRVVYLTLGQALSEVLKTVQSSPFTRLPLCEKDIDHVIGMIHVRDLFNHLKLTPGKLRFTDDRGEHGEAIAIANGLPGSALHVIGAGDIDLLKIKRNVLMVPESANAHQVLQQFQESRIHMAIVVDEYGATQGIVTLEDIVEEVVGEIEDEFDRPAVEAIERIGETWRVSGMISLHDLNERMGLNVDEPDVDTLGGYVLMQLGRFPEVGDEVRIGKFDARVLSIERRRVGKVELRPVPKEDESSEPDGSRSV